MAKSKDHVAKAQRYLETLCSVIPNRRTGSPGNQEATEFVANAIRSYGYEVDATPFECLDYVTDGVALTRGEHAFEVHVSPYSLGCDVVAELTTVSTVEELERVDCAGKILLMNGDICSEQLMPKKFVFYNPEHHQRIIALLERRAPAAIITATERKPEQVGALYPFPLFVDGDFSIPNVYCRDVVGDVLATMAGERFRLRIDARRFSSTAANVVARLNGGGSQKVVVTAHIDAYEDAPGATDNASGVVVLLLLAEMLAGYDGHHCVEILALNGEDHYSAAGQMDYLARYGDQLSQILLTINIDGVGYERGRSAYSFYESSPQLEETVRDVFQRFGGLVRGDPWFSGDHMVFVQNGVPAVAFTSEQTHELMRTVTHTSADTPDLVDCRKLVEVAASLGALIRSV